MELPRRKPMRMPYFDYGSNGAYFITICTKDKRHLLWERAPSVVGEGRAPPESQFTLCGKIVEQQLLSIQERYPCTRVDKYVIMPNHIHMILILNHITGGASPSPTVSDVMCSFKSFSARLAKKELQIKNLWQRSFYDHIIRDETDYTQIWNYIEQNPMYWEKDRFYCKEELS